MKLCKDCKWIKGTDKLALCLNPKHSKINIVTGKPEFRYKYCGVNRINFPYLNKILELFSKDCGYYGKYWEKK